MGSPAREALEVLSASPHAVTSTRPVPIKEVKDIYRSRARRNAQRGNPISGFDGLMANLDVWPYESVVVTSLPAPYGAFVVFTDADITHLAGILEPSKRTAREAQEAPATLAAS